MTLANTLFIEPTSIFGVDWTAYMIFMVLVGGLGTFEGPIIGAIVLFVIQNEFGDNGVWYLVGLGAAAIGFALLLPQGIWGSLEERFGLRIMPVGYRLRRLQ
jgi:branched-chain amino acid transport system permease protein